ncbi:MAG: DNA-binding domain-containing protein, partial [Caldimonas sp.]
MTAASSLDAFQRDFAAALVCEAADAVKPIDISVGALLRQPAFAVYRNTVAAACIDALAANFPTVLRIVGQDWFNDAAVLFMRCSPSADGRLACYGATFPTFLASFEPARDIPYLHDVARLDRLWTESHLAADEGRLDAGTLARLAPAELADAVLVPHAAARWASFREVPAFMIWQRHRDGLDTGTDIDWHGDNALLTRLDCAVTWRAITRGEAAFLDACSNGTPFGEAAGHCGDAIAQALPRLLAAGAFSR